jgi:peptidyl-prolyl cis-trans isomerase D
MLDSIRKRKDSFFSVFIVALIAIVMMFYGGGNMGGDSSGGNVASVNGDTISQQEFRQELSRRLYQYQAMLGNQYDENLLNALQIPQKTLEDLIQLKIFEQQSKKLDFCVPDIELVDHIRSLPFYQKDGKFSPEIYAKVENKGVEEKWRRDRLLISKTQNYFGDLILTTPAEIQNAHLLKNTKVELEFAKIDFKKMGHKTKPSQKDIDQAVKSNTAELKTHYEIHKKDFGKKGAYRFKQIRVGIPFQASEAKKKESKNKIESIAKKVTPANFSQVAKENSDDEYAKKGGVVGTVNEGTLEAPLEQALEKLTVNQVSSPIETSYGYYILLLEEKKPGSIPAFEDVKKQVAEKYLEEKNQSTATDGLKKAWNAQLASGKSIENELKKEKIALQKTGVFSLGQSYIPNIGQNEAILDAVFLLTKEKPFANKLYSIQGEDYFIKLKSIEYPKEKDLTKDLETTDKELATAYQSQVLGNYINNIEKKSKIKKDLKFTPKDLDS